VFLQLRYNGFVVIDFHTHIFSPRIKERRDEYIVRDACFGLLYSNAKAKLATVEELITSMDESGVDRSVVLNIGWTEMDLCRENNDYILESVARYPDRLVGFCNVNPRNGDAAVKELERCALAGAKGVGEMRSDVQSFDLADGVLMKPLVDFAVGHGMIFLTHASEPVGHDYVGKGDITPGVLYSLVKAFPDLNLVCAHWGGGLPFYALMPEVAKALGNVFFDTAATNFLYLDQIFQHVSDILGSGKILFGSDYPLVSQSKIISRIQNLDISQGEKDKILGENARSLLADASGGKVVS
jgi:uncharacterized protein